MGMRFEFELKVKLFESLKLLELVNVFVGLEFKDPPLLPPSIEGFRILAGLALSPIRVFGPFEGVLRKLFGGFGDLNGLLLLNGEEAVEDEFAGSSLRGEALRLENLLEFVMNRSGL